ncbi:MAG: R2-like ligand-binding oxidase, partial [Balneolaceae bacterium]|nr:R2-like ligand-binding oxidase [Balneolaceae bacterium]
DWESFEELEQEVTLHLISLFLAGEESVTEELLPLMLVMAREHRMEEEIYLTTFLFEEAKHTEFFHRFIDHVIPERPDLTRFHSEPYKKLFYEELPGSMQRLLTDPSSQAQAEASVTYNMIVEGVLAETGYHAFYTMLERNDLMPGLRKGVELVKRDESRHIAYGLYLLNRLVQHNPKLWPLIETRMEELLDLSLQIINDIFDRYEVMPFGLTRDEFVEYALGQFRKRMRKLESGETLQADDDV